MDRGATRLTPGQLSFCALVLAGASVVGFMIAPPVLAESEPAATASIAIEADAPAGLPLDTTPRDFIQPGTQPEGLDDPIFTSSNCRDCHGDYDFDVEPFAHWVGSMMGQASRDPVFFACLTIANQDVADVGELCMRCHTAVGWLGGRSTPSDGTGLDPEQGDFDGVTCHLCHRIVDPVFDPEANPIEDEGILADLEVAPTSESHTGQYVIDPKDRRRGPYDMGIGFPWHNWRQSPMHRESLLCANCHDVSNPALSRQADGSYKVNETDAPHPTQRKLDEFPIERTYTEWKHSVFGRAEIDLGGRFGGNKIAVSTCQDCHLPDTTGIACKPGLGGELRDDLPLHNFNGANSWVLSAVRALHPDSETGLSDEIVAASLERNRSMLERSADLEAFERDGGLVVRVTNRGGHKLPTGYGEGRRMWLNVRFLDVGGQLLEERGLYDPVAADLDVTGTTVYEMHQGLDDYMAGVTGLPPGESFHFVLNNTILKDNRLPPRGFTNAVYDAAQAGVVDHTYADEHFWDDTVYAIPAETVRVEVNLYHQTTSREYIEFLRDENRTDDRGQVAYDAWEAHGKSAPTLMGSVALEVGQPSCPAPIVYGLGKLDSVDERARLGWTGTTSVSADDFIVTVSGAIPGRTGGLVVGRNSASQPFSGGTRLVDRPVVVATFTVAGDGTAAVPVPLGQHSAQIGEEIYLQAFYSDPVDSDPVSLSDGLHIDVCP